MFYGNLLRCWEESLTPLEKDRKVFVCNNTGMFIAIDAETGKVLWRYRVTPKLYVMSGLSVNDGVVYTTGMDGYITAFSKN